MQASFACRGCRVGPDGSPTSIAIDLAVLDWNLGSGSDGLRLLEDLAEFRPDVVAILVTGFAHQATPLDALRMGVRDYLDKNADLNRETFLAAGARQLERIRPAKRQRELNRFARAVPRSGREECCRSCRRPRRSTTRCRCPTP